MEARLTSAAIVAVAFLSLGAGYRTENFLVTASSADVAQQVAETAEAMRRDLAIEWLGSEIDPWQDICPITVNVGSHLGAGGATSFMFENGRPFGWTMTIQGSRERILDSVLPHEITHTIFATHFGRPLPRWADEGACTTVEDISERQKQHDMLYEFLTTHRGIAFNEMFAMTEYPSDVLPLYSQGYSLARFFIAQGGKRKFMEYVGDGMNWDNWTRATQKHYGFGSLSELQITWLDWVRRGSPALPPQASMIAQQDPPPSTNLVPINFASRGQAATPTQFASYEKSQAENSHAVAEATAREAADSGTTAGGWYSRVRDETIASRDRVESRPVAKDAAYTSSISDDRASSQVVSRPQPVGRPGQIILEWSQTANNAPRQTLVPSQSPARTKPVHRVVPGFTGTLWR